MVVSCVSPYLGDLDSSMRSTRWAKWAHKCTSTVKPHSDEFKFEYKLENDGIFGNQGNNKENIKMRTITLPEQQRIRRNVKKKMIRLERLTEAFIKNKLIEYVQPIFNVQSADQDDLDWKSNIVYERNPEFLFSLKICNHINSNVDIIKDELG